MWPIIKNPSLPHTKKKYERLTCNKCINHLAFRKTTVGHFSYYHTTIDKVKDMAIVSTHFFHVDLSTHANQRFINVAEIYHVCLKYVRQKNPSPVQMYCCS